MGIIRNKCLTYRAIEDNGGQYIHDPNGVVSIFLPNNVGVLVPYILTQECCLKLNPNYIFDLDEQKCRWAEPQSCDIENDYNITINPNGDDGAFFNTQENNACGLIIEFDYLFKIKCEALSKLRLNNANKIGDTPQEKALLEKTNLLSASILNQQSIVSFITDDVNNINEQISNSFYTIVCNLMDSETTKVPSSSASIFANTGFGDVSITKPTSTPTIDPTINGVIYALTEPYGLSVWSKILGTVKYQEFLNGNPESYTCSDVQALIATPQNNGITHFESTIPFGFKSQLIEESTKLTLNLTEESNKLLGLTGDLDETTGTTPSLSACSTEIDMLETLNASMSLNVINSGDTESVFASALLSPIGEGNLYSYLTNNQDSGFYICGSNTCTPISLANNAINSPNCESVISNLINDLYLESGLNIGINAFETTLNENAFSSNWLHFSTTIYDPNILSLITDKKINLSIHVNHTCGDLCVLMDNIKMTRECSSESIRNVFIGNSFGFNLDKIRDNKKSWVDTDTDRVFNISNVTGGSTYRSTDYLVNDDRLVINSKEIDLNISLPIAIETDVWSYISSNGCLLTGSTLCDPCEYKTFEDDENFEFMDANPYEFMDGSLFGGSHSICCGDNKIDFNDLLTTSLDVITVERFNEILTSELIDAKNRQTISGYPTLRALYDRYLNSSGNCETNSNALTYLSIEQFAAMVGNYWSDIVEQVIPSTTIWNSVKVYSNTIFDQQKFKYKSYTTHLCENPNDEILVPSPINSVNGLCVEVESISSYVSSPIMNGQIFKPPVVTCDYVCISQMNMGSEFIGKVSVIGGDLDGETIKN